MCLNRARQRRRHRRAIEDWFHLSEHVISADGSPGFQDWLHSPASPWHWPPEQEVMLQNPFSSQQAFLQRAGPLLLSTAVQVRGLVISRVLSLRVVIMVMGCETFDMCLGWLRRGR